MQCFQPNKSTYNHEFTVHFRTTEHSWYNPPCCLSIYPLRSTYDKIYSKIKTCSIRERNKHSQRECSIPAVNHWVCYTICHNVKGNYDLGRFRSDPRLFVDLISSFWFVDSLQSTMHCRVIYCYVNQNNGNGRLEICVYYILLFLFNNFLYSIWNNLFKTKEYPRYLL